MTDSILAADPPGERPAELATSGAIARFLAQFPARSRAEALHLALKALRGMTSPSPAHLAGFLP